MMELYGKERGGTYIMKYYRMGVICDTLKNTYDKNFESENYVFLYNKMVSVFKVLNNNNDVKEFFVPCCNTSGLIATTAAIKAREEIRKCNRNAKVIAYIPLRDMKSRFTSEEELKMWNYIKKNADRILVYKSSEERLQVNELAMYKAVAKASDIVLGVMSFKDKEIFINKRSGISGNIKMTCAISGINEAIINKKPVRMLEMDEITYFDFSKKHMLR